MPVHNGLPFLDEAIQSILGQTFAEFEFVILDDASTDGSGQTLRDWASRDPRIRLIETATNLGPALSSARVAEAATAPIVARMDADDVSLPDRLGRQFRVLSEHPEVGVVASLCDLIDGRGRKIRGPDLWRLARRSWMVPFPHGAIMYRRPIFDAAGGYRTDSELWEDQDLVTRMAVLAKVMVIPEALYRVRQTTASTRSTVERLRQERAIDSMYKHLAALQETEPGDRAASRRGDKIDPRVFQALGSVILWSGARPRLFGRLVRTARLSANWRSLTAIVWTAWASASPGSLRLFLRIAGAVRNLLARTRLDVSGPILWGPPRVTDDASDADGTTISSTMKRSKQGAPVKPATPEVRSGKASR
jgi:glycosyltransferase involved in cell wall biosynthesis